MHENPTHIYDDGSGAKKIKIQNKAELTRNSAPMLASFLVNSALFCILIFFSARTIIIYVCGGIREKISKEVTKSERMCHKNNYFLLKKCMHCLYTKVRQNYFPFEQLSALVYTSRWEEEETMVLLIKAQKNQNYQKIKKEVIFNYFIHTE